MVKKWSFSGLIVLLIALSKPANCQNFELFATLVVKAQSIATDQLKNLYAIHENGSVEKYDADGNLLFVFNDRNFGSPALIDASKPFKLLLFYPDHQLIRLLDNSMSEIGSINLLQLGFQNVNAICSSLDANVWIYDEINFRLKKFDDEMKMIVQSEDLNLVLGESLHPNFMMENEGIIYVNDPLKGVFVFDKYAAYIKTIPITGLISFQVMDDQLIYFSSGTLHISNLKTLESKDISLLFAGEVSGAEIQKDRLYLLQPNQLSLYRF